MPHSSGGGHGVGGGSFGGGSYSGHSSSTSSSNSFNRETVSRHYFAQANRYTRFNKEYYVYSDHDISQSKIIDAPGLFVIFLALFAVFLGFALAISVHNPQKLDTNYDTKIVIDDAQNVIENEAALEIAMVKFRDETGITPAIVTVDQSDWTKKDKSLEKYAYNRYVDLFSDESHWLLVYSIGDTNTDGTYSWIWTGMQGNDTDPVLTSKKTDEFNTMMNENLAVSSRDTFEKAVTQTFTDVTPEIMKKTFNVPVFVIVFLILLLICIILSVNLSSWKYRNAELTEE